MPEKQKQENDETLVLAGGTPGASLPGRPLGEEASHLRIPGCELLSELGSGGMGQVFLGRQTSLNRLVAIKAMKIATPENEQLRSDLMEEARTMAALNHPNIVGCYDVAEVDGRFFLIMEYVPGQTNIRDLVLRYHGLPEETVLHILREVVGGLAYMWARGYMHRDLKPANLLLSCDKLSHCEAPSDIFANPENRIKICDFGIALHGKLGKGKSGFSLQAVGSPNYMAPEQVYAPDSVDARADIYALGSSAIFMLAGRNPLQIPDRDKLFEFKVENDIPSPLEQGIRVSRRFSDILARMTRALPEERYQDYGSLASDLDSLAGRSQTRIISRWRTFSLLLLVVFTAWGGHYARRRIHEEFFRERMVSLASTLGLWEGDRDAWRVIRQTDDPKESVMAASSMYRNLTLKQNILPGQCIELEIRHPGSGGLVLQLANSEGQETRLLWHRDGHGENSFTLFFAQRQYPIEGIEENFGQEWLKCRFELRKKGILVYLDEEPVGIVPVKSVKPCKFSIKLTSDSWVMLKKVFVYGLELP